MNKAILFWLLGFGLAVCLCLDWPQQVASVYQTRSRAAKGGTRSMHTQAAPAPVIEAEEEEAEEEADSAYESDDNSGSEPSLEKKSRKNLLQVDKKQAAANYELASKYGLPSGDNLRLFNNYLLSFDRRLKGPKWVMQVLSAANYVRAQEFFRDNLNFKGDPKIAKIARVANTEYTRSGYDRGHMAPAADYMGDEAEIAQTFVLSNAFPQVPNLNQGIWKSLENYLRILADKSDTVRVYVVTGPLFLPLENGNGKLIVDYEIIGKSQIGVPTHFFKVILVEKKGGKFSLEAFKLPNISGPFEPLNDYRVPIERLDQIERATGLIFFHKFNRQAAEWPTKMAEK